MILQRTTGSASSDDLKKLDEAVDDLAEGKPKPHRPIGRIQGEVQKPALYRHQGKSFDVIPPAQTSTLPATLKSAPDEQPLLTEGGEPELLPEHTQPTRPYTEPGTDMADGLDESELSNSEETKEVLHQRQPEKHLEHLPPTMPEAPQQSEAAPIEAQAEADVPASEAGLETGELPANNEVAVKENPKGYEEQAGLQKPTVFDTTQYHSAFAQSWEKKSRKTKLQRLVLTLVVIMVLAGGGVAAVIALS